MKHLILVGVCYIDTILKVPFYPQEDSKLRATNITVRRGGNCPNSLQVLLQLLSPEDNVIPHLVSYLPRKNCAATQTIWASFEDHDEVADFSHCIHHEHINEAASSYIIRSEQTGSRTLVNHNPLPEMTVAEFAKIIGAFRHDEDETWWHFEGRIPETTLEYIRLIRIKLPTAKVSVEVEKPGRDGLSELAAEADIVFYSRSWAEDRGHSSAETCLKLEKGGKIKQSFCAWGADGAGAMSHYPERFIFCPVEKSAKDITVVDAVGAGDTFIAGALYKLVTSDSHDDNLARSLQFAVNLATMKVQREGFGGLGSDVSKLSA